LTRTLKLALSESGENVQEVETQVWDTAGLSPPTSYSLVPKGREELII